MIYVILNSICNSDKEERLFMVQNVKKGTDAHVFDCLEKRQILSFFFNVFSQDLEEFKTYHFSVDQDSMIVSLFYFNLYCTFTQLYCIKYIFFN